jgi:hypothetical protein
VRGVSSSDATGLTGLTTRHRYVAGVVSVKASICDPPFRASPLPSVPAQRLRRACMRGTAPDPFSCGMARSATTAWGPRGKRSRTWIGCSARARRIAADASTPPIRATAFAKSSCSSRSVVVRKARSTAARPGGSRASQARSHQRGAPRDLQALAPNTLANFSSRRRMSPPRASERMSPRRVGDPRRDGRIGALLCRPAARGGPWPPVESGRRSHARRQRG